MDALGRDDRIAKPPTPLVEAKSERQSAVLVLSVSAMILAASVTIFAAGYQAGHNKNASTEAVAKKGKIGELFDQFLKNEIDGATMYSIGIFSFKVDDTKGEGKEFCKKFIESLKQNPDGPHIQEGDTITSIDFWGADDMFLKATIFLGQENAQQRRVLHKLTDAESAIAQGYFSTQATAAKK